MLELYSCAERRGRAQVGGGVQAYARTRCVTIIMLCGNPDRDPGRAIWSYLAPYNSVSSVLPSTDSKTTTRTAASPVSYLSPISTSDARRVECVRIWEGA